MTYDLDTYDYSIKVNGEKKTSGNAWQITRIYAWTNSKEGWVSGTITDFTLDVENPVYAPEFPPFEQSETDYCEKQYLTAPYCVITDCASDGTNASLGGTPQIGVGKSARIVIKSEMLKYAEGARVSYTQDGGRMRVKAVCLRYSNGRRQTNRDI